MQVYGRDDFFGDNSKLARAAIDDSLVCLVRHEPVESCAVYPVALNASLITSVIIETACLKTSLPSMRRWPTVWVEDGPPST
jgi:hypothetical protein